MPQYKINCTNGEQTTEYTIEAKNQKEALEHGRKNLYENCKSHCMIVRDDMDYEEWLDLMINKHGDDGWESYTAIDFWSQTYSYFCSLSAVPVHSYNLRSSKCQS